MTDLNDIKLKIALGLPPSEEDIAFLNASLNAFLKAPEDKPKDECPRTLALYKPGVPMGGDHSYSWSGSMPCTGVLRCTMCGKIKDDESI